MLRHLVVFLFVVLSAKRLIIHGDTLEKSDRCSSVVIGCVIDFTSRVGKEQKIAMEMAFQDHVEVFDSSSSSKNCVKLDFLIRNSKGNPAKAIASAIDLIRSQRAQAIVGSLSSQEVALISESTQNDSNEKLLFISLSSPAIPNPATPTPSTPTLIQISNDVVFQSKCIADLVNYFNWRKVTAIYEHDAVHGFSVALTFLSDSLRRVNSEIEHHTGFHISSPLLFEEELLKLKRKTNRVFIVFHFSLPSVLSLFEQANRLGMMERGYVWIISDEIATLLDSVDSSFKLQNMHGVIGVKASFPDSTEDFKSFKRRFRRAYGSEYPEEEENSSPSLFALRAYDSINAAIKARVSSENLSPTDYQGLSGEIRFQNGMLGQPPIFEIINLVGRSYQSIAFWTKRHGFVNGGFNGPIHWVGGSRTVPEGRALSSEEKPLRILVPANGAFHQFVHVSTDRDNNVAHVTGLSISVFQAVMKRLNYPRPYSFTPFYGTYDQMVQHVQNQEVDMAVGDICIISDRFEHVEFTQPYLNSGLQMVAAAEADRRREKWMFMEAFSRDMWIQLVFMHFSVCSVVCVIEIQHGRNRELEEGFGVMLWFSLTTLFFAQKEPLTCNLARFVLAPWLFAILIVGASFTASLSSMLTVPQIRPSVLDINTLIKTNAPVGCNGKSFIVRYLTDTLGFKPENVKNISSMDDYPGAFQNGDIRAAFFMAPHAEVFLAKNCQGFVNAGPTHKLGGLGFAVKKESRWAIELSKAIIEVVESKEVERLQKGMLSSFNCTSSPIKLGAGPIGPEPFSGMFSISGVICVFAFLVLLARSACKLFDEASSFVLMKAMLASMGFWRWACTRKLPSAV